MIRIPLLCLGMLLAQFWAQAGEPSSTPAMITNRAGERLANPRIIAFDGETFQVEHDGGVAAIAWAAMPDAFRKGYQYDADKAARARQVREIRRQAAEEEAMADGDGQEFAGESVAPEPAPAPTPLAIERDIRIGDRYYLSTIGGPPVTLQIRRISQTEITFSRDRYESQTVERKLGFNEPRTLLFSDHGCDVYWVERVDPNRDRYSTTIQFEYAPNAASRPR
jgi:hypothetical protein